MKILENKFSGNIIVDTKKITVRNFNFHIFRVKKNYFSNNLTLLILVFCIYTLTKALYSYIPLRTVK